MHEQAVCDRELDDWPLAFAVSAAVRVKAGTLAHASAIGFAGIGVHHKPAGGAWTLNASLEGRHGTEAFAEIRASATAAILI